MPFLELHALVQAALTWGEQWRGKRVVFMCDCQPVVFQCATMTSKDSDCQALLRQLSTTAGLCGFDFRAEHIPGATNTVADLLSRPDFSMAALRQLLPDARATPDVPVPMPRLDRM